MLINIKAHKKKFYSWSVFCILIICLILSTVSPLSASTLSKSGKLSERYKATSGHEHSIIYAREPWYSEVLAKWKNDGKSPVTGNTDSIIVDAGSYAGFSGSAPEIKEIEGISSLCWNSDTEWIEWDFNVKNEGLYAMIITYYPIEGNGLPIQRSIELDGSSPYDEASTISLPRLFVDKEDPRINSLGDETRPLQVEIREWITKSISDSQGKYSRPLLWDLTAGDHKLRINIIDQPIAIEKISFVAPYSIPSYKEVSESYKTKGYVNAVQSLVIQAEDRSHIKHKTQGSISIYSDGDPLSYPDSTKFIRMNAIGGYSWREGNQEISYKIDIPESGLYKLALRVAQAWGNGLSSCRQIKINGEVPFEEMSEYKFRFDRNWYTEELADDSGEPYLFYFEKGENTITFTVKIGDELSQALELMYGCSEELSEVIRKITMITGTNPDPNYDYDIEKAIPTLFDTFNNIIKDVDTATNLIMHVSNKRPSIVNNLQLTVKQLKEMMAAPDKISRRLNDLATGLTNLGNSMTSLKEQCLGIDSIGVYSPAAEVSKKRSTLLMKIWSTFYNFVISFQKDYNAIGSFGDSTVKDKMLSVWISRGKEWGEILQELAESGFTAEHDIGVKLNVLPSGTLASAVNPLILSINSGTAPDAVLSVPPGQPVEHAIRNTVVDLSKFSDYDSVASRFDSKISTPFKYRGGVYALPETANFSVMFYRKDIINEMDLDIPDTWDEIYEDLLPVLYQNNMQMYIPATFGMFLKQIGGNFYTEDGLRSALDTPEAFEAFDTTVSLFTEKGFPIAANFFNRFKSGEMPIGIDGYAFYISLLTAAPELAGKWGIAPIPGTVMKDGSIDRSTVGITGEADIILDQSKKQEDAWEFLKWWTSTETQVAFGVQVEGRIGSYARWNTANLEAFESLPWKRTDLAVIKEQWEWTEDPPTVLGGYFTDRHINNAFARCFYSNYSTRDSLEESVEQINKELVRKQEMYGIFTGANSGSKENGD